MFIWLVWVLNNEIIHFSLHALCRYHSQRITSIFAAGDPGFCQLSVLRSWVWYGWYLLLLPKGRGEHSGWWSDQAIFSPGTWELESADSEQLQLPSHKYETYIPVGAGTSHPLWHPAASQVWLVSLKELWLAGWLLRKLFVLFSAGLLLQSLALVSSYSWPP